MSIFSERLVEARKNANMTQKKLAELLNITPTRLNYWEKGKREPDVLMIKNISKFLKVNPNYLIGLNTNDNLDYAFSQEETELIKKYRKLDDIGKELINKSIEIELKRLKTPKVQQKIYSISSYDMPVSAGTGQYLDYTNCSVMSLKNEPPANADFVLSVSGDSMEPTFYDGDKVFVEETNSLNIGDIGIFYYDGDVYIKEYGENGLISHNEKYKLIRGSENMRILGKVLGIVEE